MVLQIVLQYALRLLLHLAEEADALDSRRRQALVRRMQQHTGRVLLLAQQVSGMLLPREPLTH